MTGTITRLLSDKGFGYLRPANDRREFFFHRSAVSGAEWYELFEGQPISFVEEASPRGLRATRVVVERETP